ncbi:MAG: hypothetical protein WBE74_26000 [Terracidiphilus sp.]
MANAAHATIFDAGRGYGAITGLRTLVDCTVAKRDGRWWMFACGVERTSPEIQIYSASLPEGGPLSAEGWSITPDNNAPSQPKMLAGKSRSYPWDGKGGRHCPSYVKGWDAEKNAWVERIYYAGAAHHFMGPYTIGYLEWDGAQWVDQPEPAFVATDVWEHRSVYEPNLIYHEGKWKMWYVAGANQDDYLVQGYAESPDGRTKWSTHRVVFPADERVFDFCAVAVEDGFEAVFARVNVTNADLPKTGLWWCRAKEPSANISDWTEPVRISEPGPWKPVLRHGEIDRKKLFVFHDGVYPAAPGSVIPIHFTINCLEIHRPA